MSNLIGQTMPSTSIDTKCRCRICGTDSGHHFFRLREMYFGTREEFDYFECINCGTIQIRDIPTDMSKYYPSNYYSFGGSPAKPTTRLQIALRRTRSDAMLGHGGMVGNLLSKISKRKPDYFCWFKGIPLNTHSRIVDVGCGRGELLLKMQRDGFCQLSGLDPFIASTIENPNGVTVHKRSLVEDAGTYDLIMLHHSFEHMPDPVGTMAAIARHMSPTGRTLIRLPIAGGYAWRTYRENWYALDAPRHLIIPSIRAIKLLAETAGLEVERHFFDSDIAQFLSSEAYCKGIPLIELMRSPHLNSRSKEEIAALREKAEELNRNDDGDCGGFILKHRQT